MGYELDDSTPLGWRYVDDLDSDGHTFRSMTDDDTVTDEQLRHAVARTHPPLELDEHPASHILLPDDYEREHWDAARTDPRPS